jgi:ribonuclease kappa
MLTNITAFGLFYGAHVEALTGTNEDPKDPDAVSRACYFAAAIYAAFIAFCGLQVSFSSTFYTYREI